MQKGFEFLQITGAHETKHEQIINYRLFFLSLCGPRNTGEKKKSFIINNYGEFKENKWQQ